jgi:hypothetical protein
MNFTSGGFVGYSSENVSESSNVPPSHGVSSGLKHGVIYMKEYGRIRKDSVI